MFPRDGLTSEYFDSVGLAIYQPKNGHRYGEESLELARFCSARPDETVAELGAGCGVISLIIAARDRPKKVVGVEIQCELCSLAKFNALENGIMNTEFVNQDWRDFSLAHAGEFDLVLSNPPFFAAGSGRKAFSPARTAARHEIHGTLSELVSSAARLISNCGRFVIVFPQIRRTELLDTAANCGLGLRREEQFNSCILCEFQATI